MSVMAGIEMEFIELTSLIGDSGSTCDNAGHEWCGKGPVRWIVHIQCPECRAREVRLWCTGCKDLVLTTEDGFECGRCDEPVFPARKMVNRFEPLEGK